MSKGAPAPLAREGRRSSIRAAGCRMEKSKSLQAEQPGLNQQLRAPSKCDKLREENRSRILGEMTEMPAGRMRPGSLQLSPSNSIVGQSVTILSFLASAWLRLARLYMLNSVRLELVDI